MDEEIIRQLSEMPNAYNQTFALQVQPWQLDRERWLATCMVYFRDVNGQITGRRFKATGYTIDEAGKQLIDEVQAVVNLQSGDLDAFGKPCGRERMT